MTAATDVVAVHLSHHNPPTPELTRVLRAWGARVVDDLTAISVGDEAPIASVPHRQLLLGGARSGKSIEAERSLAAHPRVTYVATGGTRDGDAEWAARVRAHRDRRPASWTTTESLDVAAALRTADAADAVLVDCLALWLAGSLDGLERSTWASRVRSLMAASPSTARIKLSPCESSTRYSESSWPMCMPWVRYENWPSPQACRL